MPSIFEEQAARNTLSGKPIPQGNVFEQAAKAQPSIKQQFKEELNSPEESPFEQGVGQAVRAGASAIGSIPRNLLDIKDIAGEFLYDSFAPSLGLTSSKDLPKSDKIFPTEQDIKQSFDKYTEGRYQPETEFDRRNQEFLGDFFGMLLPVKGKVPFLRSIAIAASGQTAQEAAKQAKVGEEGQDLVKQGTMLVASLVNPKAAQKFVDKSFDKFRQSIPAKTPINTEVLDNELGGFISNLEKGLGKTVADKAKVLVPAEALKKKAMSNFMELDDLIEAKIDVNRIMGEPETLKGAEKYLKGLAKIVDDSLEKIAHVNPESLKLYRDANSAFGSLRESEKIGRNVRKVIKRHPLKSAGAAFALDALMGIPLSTLAGGTATGYAALKGFELLQRMTTNKQFAGLYLNLIKEGAAQNQAGISKYLRKIDKEAKEEE